MARKPPFLARLLEAMRAHGEDSDSEMEVGDLQGLVRDLWSLLPRKQRVMIQNSDQYRDIINQWGGGES